MQKEGAIIGGTCWWQWKHLKEASSTTKGLHVEVFHIFHMPAFAQSPCRSRSCRFAEDFWLNRSPQPGKWHLHSEPTRSVMNHITVPEAPERRKHSTRSGCTHLYGFSPVCVRTWAARAVTVLNAAMQPPPYVHTNGRGCSTA